MIVGNQLTPFTSRYSKIVVRQSIVSHDNFVVYLFYFENSNYLNRSAKSVIDLVIYTLDTARRTTDPRSFLHNCRTRRHTASPNQAGQVSKEL